MLVKILAIGGIFGLLLDGGTFWKWLLGSVDIGRDRLCLVFGDKSWTDWLENWGISAVATSWDLELKDKGLASESP